MSRRTFDRGGAARVALAALVALTACAKDEPPGGGASGEGKGRGGSGDTVVVEMHSDGGGNYFTPASIEVRRGDVVRWVLRSGVHNVNFLPDSNAGTQGLPRMSDMLQIPGQTYDLAIDLAAGRYFYQCDPHALLGMIGYVLVKDS